MPTQQIKRLQQIDTLMIPDTGWYPVQETWNFALSGSADAPVYKINVQANVTGSYPIGSKVQCNCSAGQSPFMGFIVGVDAFANGVTPIYVYGGTDFALSSGTISSPQISNVKSPLGFPMSPAKWGNSASDSSDRTTSTNTTTWQNLSTVSLGVPMGLWKIGYSEAANVSQSVAGVCQPVVGLSTTTGITGLISDTVLTAATAPNTGITISLKLVDYLLSLTLKTTLYLNTKAQVACTSVTSYNASIAPATLNYVCAYL